MTETKLALEQGALTLSNSQVCFRTLKLFRSLRLQETSQFGYRRSFVLDIPSDVTFRLSAYKNCALSEAINFGRLTSTARNSRFAATT